MKISKTNEDEIYKLNTILCSLGQLSGEFYEEIPDISWDDHDQVKDLVESDPRKLISLLCNALQEVNYSRILMNAVTMLSNCADPDLDHLDFNKDIKEGLDLLEKHRARQDERTKTTIELPVTIIDEQGYPTNNYLKWIEFYDVSKHSLSNLMNVILGNWMHEKSGYTLWGEHKGYRVLELSTLGDPGNELVIKAMKDNLFIFPLYWLKEERGGHYWFSIPVEMTEGIIM